MVVLNITYRNVKHFNQIALKIFFEKQGAYRNEQRQI